MKADAKTRAAVLAVMDKFATGYAQRNLEGVMSVVAPDRDTVMLGTGADEKRIGLTQIKAQLKRDWSQSDSASISYDKMSVSAAGPVAWMAGDVTFNGSAQGKEFSIQGRLTAVLERRRGKWLIVQSHFSTPLASQTEGESFPA